MYKQYRTRSSGRYNTPGHFVPANESLLQSRPPQQQQQPLPVQPPAPLLPAPRPTPMQVEPDMDVKMDPSLSDESMKQERPPWMKSKLQGVKKVSNKERRRRQNETLRRLLTPKNALMVLNEMKPNEQITNQFKVEPSPPTQNFFQKSTQAFCADLNLEGENYKGYGDNKLSARNAAAEQAIRDILIKKMNKIVSNEGGPPAPGADAEEDTLPMIQLASFALHKLFTEWEYEGHKVPQLRPQSCSWSEPSTADATLAPTPTPPTPTKKPRRLPVNAAAMHPCMLLTYMRPHLEYRELAAFGDKPQNMIFTIAVDVDGETYAGKAPNKKEARKEAARAACEALFGVHFDPSVTANQPIAPA